ncbi:MAG TPA: glycerate kinase [Puia sp.]|nr:glycerate kinase [Puia sp.]
MNILISPNAFKNSLDASSAAKAIEQGLMESELECSCQLFPVGDGGDGTAKLLLTAANGVSIAVPAHDPLGRMIQSSIGISKDGKTGFIEMADASGLRLLQPSEYNPLKATSFGTGELILELLNRNVQKIILGIGGSATVDGGVGLLEALGFKFLDAKEKELRQIPSGLENLAYIVDRNIDHRINNASLIVLCDVQNKLLGHDGSAAVFGPQKGASPKDIPILEDGLLNFRNLVLEKMGKDMATIVHGGAAGGIAASLFVFFDAQLVDGIEYFLDITDFDQALSKADILITGEGSMDIQTLQGKAPMGVARRAKEKGIPVIALAGSISQSDEPALRKYFDLMMPINPDGISINNALQQTASNLRMTAKKIADSIASGQIKF